MSTHQVLETAQVRPESAVEKGDVRPFARLVSIDLLRGGAALAVVFHHAINWDLVEAKPLWFRAVHAIFDQGYLGVPLFFVISGFCIHLRWAKGYAREGQSRLNFADFWKRRIKRLYPPYV